MEVFQPLFRSGLSSVLAFIFVACAIHDGLVDRGHGTITAPPNNADFDFSKKALDANAAGPCFMHMSLMVADTHVTGHAFWYSHDKLEKLKNI